MDTVTDHDTVSQSEMQTQIRMNAERVMRHTYGSIHWMQLFQHVRDDDLQKRFSEEFLAHSAAIIVIFLPMIRTNAQKLFAFFVLLFFFFF